MRQMAIYDFFETARNTNQWIGATVKAAASYPTFGSAPHPMQQWMGAWGALTEHSFERMVSKPDWGIPFWTCADNRDHPVEVKKISQKPFCDLLQFDLGWSLLIASRPLVLLHASLVIVTAAALRLAEATLHAQTLLVVSLALLPLYGLYFAIGIFWVGINGKRLAHLLAVPAVLCELIVIAVRALIRGESKHWNRTPREQEQA